MHEEAAKQANPAGLSAWAGSEPSFYWGVKSFTLSTNISGTIAIFPSINIQKPEMQDTTHNSK